MDNNNEGGEMKTWMAEIADRIIRNLDAMLDADRGTVP